MYTGTHIYSHIAMKVECLNIREKFILDVIFRG